MIDKYRKSTNQILLRKKLDNSLNNYFLGELYNVKSKENFSDADYFINEIKFETAAELNAIFISSHEMVCYH